MLVQQRVLKQLRYKQQLPQLSQVLPQRQTLKQLHQPQNTNRIFLSKLSVLSAAVKKIKVLIDTNSNSEPISVIVEI